MICNKKTKPKMSILLSADSEGRHSASVLLDLIINRRINLVLEVLEQNYTIRVDEYSKIFWCNCDNPGIFLRLFLIESSIHPVAC